MAEKKPRPKKKAASNPAKVATGQQTTLLTLFRKQPTSSDAVDVSSDTDRDEKSDEGSIIDVCGDASSPPRIQQTRKGKRARQSEREPSPPLSVPSSPLSTPPSTPPTSHMFDPSTSTDVYGSLRRSRARSIVTMSEKPPYKVKIRPLFAVVRKNRSRPGLSPAESQERLEGSQEVPIEVAEEDEPEPVIPLTSTTVHAFFQPRKGKGKATNETSTATVTAGTSTGRMRRDGIGLDAPWPSSESGHVTRTEDKRLEPRVPCIPRRTIVNASTSSTISDEQTKAWAEAQSKCRSNDMLNLSPGWFDAWAGLRKEAPSSDDEIPAEHALHPAVARLLGPDGAQHAFGPPARACEVLGNEDVAQELADWLKQLEIRRNKGEEIQSGPVGKPRERKILVTHVDRRKRRKVENQNEYDPGMVNDQDIEDDIGDEPPENYEMLVHLGNTYIIGGPAGSGKSAAVHACAKELGWTVFEVYAGIGRRGIGSNGLASLIGSVGANHTVGGNGDGEVQQSLILLDDVDLVFEQDTQFWSAVVALVRESRRPVVMTCNDLTCVPTYDLPVHRLIEFQAASPALGGSYLYAQARAAGCVRLPSRDKFEALFTATALGPRVPDFAMQDAPQHPLPSQLDRSPDLRRALEDLKFWLLQGRGGGTYTEIVPRDVRDAWAACGRDVMEQVGDWSAEEVVHKSSINQERTLARLWRFADNVSMVDADLERRWIRQMQAEEVDRFMPSEDDEVRTGQLSKPLVPYEQVGIAEYCWDAEVALEAMCAARRALEGSGAGGYARVGLTGRRGWDSRRLEEVRAEHQEMLAVLLSAGRLVSGSTPLLPRPALVQDMIPAVRTMVAADDEMLASAARVVRGRSVRSSARMAAMGQVQHERYIGLNDVGLEALRATEYCS